MEIDLFYELGEIAKPLNAEWGKPESDEEDYWINYPLIYDEENEEREIYVYAFAHQPEGSPDKVIMLQARIGLFVPGMNWVEILTDAYYNVFSRLVTFVLDEGIEMHIQASLPIRVWNPEIFKMMVAEVAINADFWAREFEQWKPNDHVGGPPMN